MPRLSLAVSALALVGAFASNPAGAVERVFVASFGSDANTATNCGLADPCRHFSAAMTVVDSGGEVVALDSAGFGAVTITKSVTIAASPGSFAGISAASGVAVSIPTPGVNVILRGLSLNSTGAPIGVAASASKLSIENCLISNFVSAGVTITGSATLQIFDSIIRGSGYGVIIQDGPTATISGSKFLANGNTGISVASFAAGTTTTAAISDSLVSGNHNGVFADAQGVGATARISVTRSTVSNNIFGVITGNGAGTQSAIASNNLVTGNSGAGFYQLGATGTSTLESLGNNTVRQNGVDTVGTITAVSGL
jgi:Right handed beta helix region